MKDERKRCHIYERNVAYQLKPPFLLLLRAQSPMPVQCAECPNWPNWSHSILPLAGDCEISISDWMDGGRNEITRGSPKIEHELLPAFAKGAHREISRDSVNVFFLPILSLISMLAAWMTIWGLLTQLTVPS